MTLVYSFTEEQYKVETRTIAVDFGKTDIYPKIEAGLAGLEIGVLGMKRLFSLLFFWPPFNVKDINV